MKISVERPFVIMKIATLLLVCHCLVLSCTSGAEKKNLKNQSDHSLVNTEIPEEITPEQQSAFDAFNKLQMQIRGSRIYSTFPGINHPCYPADTSYVITRVELLFALEDLLSKYCTDIPIEECNRLAGIAVLAQEEYLVKHCYGTSMQMVDSLLVSVRTRTSPSGTWIIPKVLGRTDVVLDW